MTLATAGMRRIAAINPQREAEGTKHLEQVVMDLFEEYMMHNDIEDRFENVRKTREELENADK